MRAFELYQQGYAIERINEQLRRIVGRRTPARPASRRIPGHHLCVPFLGPLNPAEVLGFLRRSAATLTRRVRPDHRAIQLRSVQFSPQNMARLYLYVAVAPSRFAPRPFDDTQVRRARAFAADAFPELFGDVPRSADERTILFTVERDHTRERSLYIHPSGLVELLWALGYEDDGKDGLALDPVEMVWVIAQLAGAVSRPPYAELSRAGRGRHRRARVDWWFHTATAISDSNGPRSWTALSFPGDSPPRAQHDWAAAPSEGYGWHRLSNSRRARPPDEIARTFLAEFLTANGYYEFMSAIGDTVAASHQWMGPEATASSS